eukprot:GHVU01077584.1.p1 GENE.GHVU01077584.1~~GHVU01077584.1.p1  ORF type:complete len:173 (+),score=40.31 GHVU01077584.1:283-801(+)
MSQGGGGVNADREQRTVLQQLNEALQDLTTVMVDSLGHADFQALAKANPAAAARVPSLASDVNKLRGWCWRVTEACTAPNPSLTGAFEVVSREELSALEDPSGLEGGDAGLKALSKAAARAAAGNTREGGVGGDEEEEEVEVEAEGQRLPNMCPITRQPFQHPCSQKSVESI